MYAAVALLAALTLSPVPQPATLAEMTYRAELSQAIAELPEADEIRYGYVRTAFRHWTDADADGCNTRWEVLADEARTPAGPTEENSSCVPDGEWISFYDQVTVTDPAQLDIDHMVPLAEAWDSGASAWTPQRREQYANDLGDPRSLLAVTAKTNRSKADQDPTGWLPPDRSTWCLYIAWWTAVKHRWQLTADPGEKQALELVAANCAATIINVELAADDQPIQPM